MPADRRQLLATAAGVAAVRFAPAADPPRGLVNGHPQAAAAGMDALAAGGNAVDAVVSAALVAGVVAVSSAGIGGYGGHLVVARPDGRVFALDFNTTAPAAATPDMFAPSSKGVVAGSADAYGWRSVGVPGVLAGLQFALDKFGTKGFAEVAQPAIRYAADGFSVPKELAAAFKSAAPRFAKDLGSSKLFLPNGKPPAEGDTHRNPDLAAMLSDLAAKGRVDDFYTGLTAQKIADAFRANGGLVTATDLAAYRAEEVSPVSSEWRGLRLWTPPPTAGGLTVLQSLATLKALNWNAMDPADPATTHARIEALRLAWADRLHLFGDPKATDVPADKLLSPAYAEAAADRVRAAVKEKQAIPGGTDGRPVNGTIHLNAVDATGLTAALTFTHGEGFGSGVTVDGLGLLLGHGLSRFDPRPGRPNSVAPGKRPLNNMCPTVGTRDGKPVLALGAFGGRRIPNTVFDVASYRLGQGRPLADAVNGPRVHTEGDLNLTMERTWPEAVVARMKEAGYTVAAGAGANLSAIERDPATGALTAAAR